jgi:hypothetical protein
VNASEITQILKRDVSYKTWQFFVASDGSFLQVRFSAGFDGAQHGRKWRLSEHMTRSEIVQTALMAVLAAEEHEARERFRYRGQPIFGPHFDVEQLYALTNTPLHLDVRPTPHTPIHCHNAECATCNELVEGV